MKRLHLVVLAVVLVANTSCTSPPARFLVADTAGTVTSQQHATATPRPLKTRSRLLAGAKVVLGDDGHCSLTILAKGGTSPGTIYLGPSTTCLVGYPADELPPEKRACHLELLTGLAVVSLETSEANCTVATPDAPLSGGLIYVAEVSPEGTSLRVFDGSLQVGTDTTVEGHLKAGRASALDIPRGTSSDDLPSPQPLASRQAAQALRGYVFSSFKERAAGNLVDVRSRSFLLSRVSLLRERALRSGLALKREVRRSRAFDGQQALLAGDSLLSRGDASLDRGETTSAEAFYEKAIESFETFSDAR